MGVSGIAVQPVGEVNFEASVQFLIERRTGANIYTKIGVSNRATATRWAVAHRVVDGVPGG